MPSKVTIRFDGIPSNNDYVGLREHLGVGFNLRERFVNIRQNAFDCTIDQANRISVQRANYVNSFNADYNSLNEYVVTYLGSNTVSIEHPNSNHFTVGNTTSTTSDVVIESVENTTDPVDIDFTDISFSAGVDACNNVQVDVTTSVLATKVLTPVLIDPNSNNPFSFEWVRGDLISLRVENADAEQNIINVQLPEKIVEANLGVNVLNSPNGASATATYTHSDLLDLEYSIDDSNWYSENVFTSLIPDSYTMYVRDQFGCKISTPFTVVDFNDEGVGVTSPVAELPPKSNSIRYYKTKQSSENSIDENTQSIYTPYVINPKLEIQKFKTLDNITTQFRSNYDNITAKVVNENGTETNIPVSQVTNNVGLKDSRDAIRYDLGEGQTGVYFTSGNIYDYGTTNVLSTYSLNGSLPAWGKLGNYIYINGGWNEIVNIAYDKSKTSEVLIINSVYNGVDETVQVASIYNSQDYNVFEFYINFALLSGKYQKVYISYEDSKAEYPSFYCESEIIEVRDSFYRHIEIEYWNNENSGDIMYNGIKHKINVPIVDIVGKPLEEAESDMTDTSAYLIESSVHEADEITFSWVSKGLMRKLILSLNHDNVLIDGVGYVKDGATETESVRNTNLYKVKATMIKKGNAFTNKPQGDSSGQAFDVPNLIVDQGNYIKYK